MPLFSINMGREEIGKGKSQGTLRRMSATRHRGQCQACGNIKCKAQKSTFRSKAQRSTFRCKAQQSTYQGQGAARRTSGARCISGARRSKVHLRGKAQQGASQGQGATRSISGARHSKAHVRGKVQQGTCQGKVQQGTCQGKVQQGTCQGKTQQGACQGKTQQGTCQGKTQGTCHGQDAMRHMSQARCREVHERHLTLVQVKGAFFQLKAHALDLVQHVPKTHLSVILFLGQDPARRMSGQDTTRHMSGHMSGQDTRHMSWARRNEAHVMGKTQ